MSKDVRWHVQRQIDVTCMDAKCEDAQGNPRGLYSGESFAAAACCGRAHAVSKPGHLVSMTVVDEHAFLIDPPESK